MSAMSYACLGICGKYTRFENAALRNQGSPQQQQPEAIEDRENANIRNTG
jgi:hypothetical protein